MKKFAIVFISLIILASNTFAATEKELKNKIGILTDLKENLIALNEGQKGTQKKRCNRPPLKNINFNVVIT